MDTMTDFRVGDHVRIDARTTQWTGQTGTIAKTNPTRARVTLDTPLRGMSGGRTHTTVNVPYGMLTHTATNEHVELARTVIGETIAAHTDFTLNISRGEAVYLRNALRQFVGDADLRLTERTQAVGKALDQLDTQLEATR